MASGRYVKVNITSNWGDPSSVCMVTLHACDAEGVKWNDETMPHTAGSTSSGSPSNCSDLDIQTYWQFSVSDLPNWWKVDLGQVRDISKFKTRVYPGLSYHTQNMKDFTVQVSDNDVDWTTILTAQTADSSDEQVFDIVEDIEIESSIPISPVLSGTIDTIPRITTSIPISPVLSGTLEIPFSITASIPISPILSGMIDTIPRIAVSIPINIDISGVLTSIESHPGIDVTLPTLQFNGTGICDCIGHFNTAIPSLISNIQGYFNEIGTLDANIPGPRFSASGLTGEVGDLAVLLPMLALNAKAEVSEVGNLSVTLPSLTCKMTLEEDLVGNLILTLPFQRIALNGYLSAFGNLAVTIPMLKLSLSATPFSYLNLVMNIRNRALTEYTNYNFNSFCRFNGKHLGATSTKIHDLDTGDTDDGDLIDWNFRTGYLDLEQKFKKRLRQAWFSYKSNGDLIVTIVLPAGTEYEYDLEGYEETENGVRVKFGKGIRSKYIALDVRNVAGSSVVIDALRLHFEKSGGVR